MPPMTTPDPLLASAREVLRRSLQEMSACIEGLGPEALNWRPAGEDTNSIAVLATHSLESSRYWLATALGAPPPPRDRDSEFLATAPDAKSLLDLVDRFGTECLGFLHTAGGVDWSAPRETHARPNSGDPTHVPAAWCLLHALSHLREHVGQMMLTRQLWEQRHR